MSHPEDKSGGTEVHFRLAKCWQGATPLVVWQASVLTSGPSGRFGRKAFLVVDANQKTFGLRLVVDKPNELSSQGILTNLIRKYLPTSTLKSAELITATGDIWLTLHTGENDTWHLMLTKKSPPELRLIGPGNLVHGRISSAGSFTKKRNLEEALPEASPVQGRIDLLGSLLAALPNPDGDLQPVLQPAAKADDTAVFPIFQREARDRLARRLKTLKKSLVEHQSLIPTHETVAHAQEAADLAKTFAYLITEGLQELIIPAEAAGHPEEVRIELNPDHSPGQNIDGLFVRSKKLKTGRELGLKRLATLQVNVAAAERDLNQLRSGTLDEAVVNEILERHQLRRLTLRGASAKSAPRANAGERKPYRVFFSGDDAHPPSPRMIFVGKGALENDELTKAAKSNDFWLHAVGVTGSHVIVPTRNSSETGLSERLLRDAGILALHFSKLRGNNAGEVYVTRKQFLKKRKGMPAGLWQVDKSESVYIRYSDEELARILMGTTELTRG